MLYSLSENIEKLENRCEELQRLLDEARHLLEKQQNQQRRRRERRKSSTRYSGGGPTEASVSVEANHDYGSKMSEESEEEEMEAHTVRFETIFL